MTIRIVADFRLEGADVAAAELAKAAAAAGAQFLAVTAPDEETPQAFVDGARVADLARMAKALRKEDVGLFLRIEGTAPVFDLREALEITKGTMPTTLRERIVVAVKDERTGKRLRREAPEFPSAYELSPKGEQARGLLRFTSPMWQRAAADAEDLVVPFGRIGAASLASKYESALRRRGSRLWVSDVEEKDLAEARDLPVHGLVVRLRFA